MRPAPIPDLSGGIYYWSDFKDTGCFSVMRQAGEIKANCSREDMMIRRSKFSIGYYLIMFLGILFLETMFFSGPAVKEIP